MATIMQNGGYIQYGPKVIPGLRENQNMHLLGEKSFTTSTTSTTALSIGTILVNNVHVNDLIMIDIQDVAGRRNDHFLYMRQLIYMKATGSNTPNYQSICDSAGTALNNGTSANGIYCNASTLSGDKLTLTISQKYNTTYTKTIDGTYRVRVYKVVL